MTEKRTSTYKRSSMMEARLAQNRKIIFQAARRIIAKGGFKDVQVAGIAREAGVSTGLIYRYFSSKDQLLVEILTDAVLLEIAILDEIASRPQSASACLRAAIVSFTSRALAGSRLAYAFIAEPLDSAAVETERMRCHLLFGNVFKNILHRGIKEKDFRAIDVDASAACIVGSMTQALIMPISNPEAQPIDKTKLIDAIADFCVQAVS